MEQKLKESRQTCSCKGIELRFNKQEEQMSTNITAEFSKFRKKRANLRKARILNKIMSINFY